MKNQNLKSEVIELITRFDANDLYRAKIGTSHKSNSDLFSYGIIRIKGKTFLHEGAEFDLSKLNRMSFGELTQVVNELKMFDMQNEFATN